MAELWSGSQDGGRTSFFFQCEMFFAPFAAKKFAAPSGSSWVRVGFELGSSWVRVGFELGSSWVRVGFELGSSWVRVGFESG